MGVFRALSLDFLRQYFPRLYESMRIDPLRGYFSLQNVEISPSQPFTIASFPLQVESGTVASLSLHLPWMHITTAPIRVVANSVHLVLSEPQESAQSAVFAALVSGLQRSKNRQIIEAETDVTPLTRALQKLLPFLLHRVELDLRDIQLSIRFSSNCIIRLSLSSVTTHAPTSSHADLAKAFVVNSFSIQAFSLPFRSVSSKKPDAVAEEQSRSQELLSLNISSAELTLTLADSQYDFDLAFPRRIPIVAHADLLPSLQKIFRRRRFWRMALLYKRPTVDVGTDPAAWFRYAFRVVSGTFGTLPTLRLPIVLRVFRSCIEYQRLHVLQLSGELGIADEAALHTLENELNLEVLLLLRANARKYAVADDMSSYSTRNWVSWALFGKQMISDSDKIAYDVRRSLFAIDREEVQSKTLQRALNWSKARMSFCMAGLSFSLKGFGHKHHIYIHDTQIRAEVGPSFESFSVFASITDISVSCGSLHLFGKAVLLGDAINAETNDSEILTVRAHKYVIDQRTAVQVQLSPLAIVFNFDVVRAFIDHLDSVLIQDVPLSSCEFLGSLDHPRSFSREDVSSKKSQGLVSFVFGIPQCDVLIVSETLSDILHSDCRRSGVGMTLSNFEIQLKPSDLCLDLRGCVDVSLKSGFFEAVKRSHPKSSSNFGTFSVRLADEFGVSCVFDLTLLAMGSDISLTVDGIRVKAELARLAPFLDLVTEARTLLLRDTLSSSISLNKCEPGSLSPVGLSNDIPSSLGERHVRIASVFVEFTKKSHCDCENSRISIKANDFHIYESSKGLNTSISTISVVETSGGKIHVRPGKRAGNGLAVTVSLLPSKRCLKVEGVLDTVNVELPLRSVTATYHAFLSLNDLAVSLSQGWLHEGNVHPRSSPMGLQTSLGVNCMSIELPLPCGIRATFNGMHMACHDALVDGTCKTVELKDLSARHLPPGAHISRFGDLRSTLERRSLSFSIGRGFVNVHLSCVHLTMFVSTIHRIHLALMDLVSELSPPNRVNDNAKTGPHFDGHIPPASPPTKITVQASNVSFCFVVASLVHEHVCFDVQNILTVMSPISHVFSIRKLSILTGSTESTEPPRVREDDLVSGGCPWNVLLRHADIDISHHVRTSSTYQSATCKDGHKLFATILSRIIIYLASSQARILVNVLTQLLTFGSRDVVSPNSINRPIRNETSDILTTFSRTSLSQRSHFSEFSLECESQPISIELLSDHKNDPSSSAIASIELDPIYFSLNVALGLSLRKEATRVVVWKASCPSLRIEDRDSNVGPSRRVVVETEDSWLGLLSSLNTTARKEAGNMGVSIEGTFRAQHGRTTSSHEICLKRARIVLSSSLHIRVSDFLKRCIPSSYSGSSNNSETPPAHSQSKVYLGRVSTKVSVHLTDSVVSLLSSDPNMGDSVLEAHSKMSKASLLFSEGGLLLKESILRWRNLHLSLFWRPLARIGQTGCEAIGLIQNGSTSLSLGFVHESVASRSFMNSDYESILLIKNGSVQFPALGRDYYRILVSDAVLESSISVIKNTIALLRSIDMGGPPKGNGTSVCPGFKIVVIRLLAKVKIPVSEEDLKLCPAQDNCVDLGLDTSADVEVLKGAKDFHGSVQIAADVTDSKGQCIHLMSPTPLHFRMETSAFSSLKCWTKKYARVTLSPLVLKTLAGLIFSLLREEFSTRRRNGPVFATDSNTNDDGSSSLQRHVQVSLKGLFVYFLADEPRMQLMRLLLRDVVFNAHIPMKNGNKGTLNISVLDMALEDSISWRMPWKPDDERAERWSKLVIGRRSERGHGFGFNNNESSSRLQDSANVVKKWIRRVRGKSNSDGELEKNDGETNVRSVFPLLSCTLRWVSPMEHVTARVKVEGLDFHVDLAVLSSIADWIQTVMRQVANVKAAFCARGSNSRGFNALNVRVDHIVLEPVCVRVAIRAPPRRIRETLLEKLVNTTLSAETAEGVELRFPRLVFNGDFFGMESLFERIEALYVRTVTSKLFARQLIWQFPNFLKSARVIITCFTRRREYGLLNQVETVAFSEDRMRRGRRDVGLLTILAGETPHLRGIVGMHWQVSPLIHWTGQNEDNMSTLDITQHLT